MREGRRCPDPGRERGQMLILFTFGLMVFLGFVALVIDVGLAFHERRQLQNAVDAAALAAAQDLAGGQSTATVMASAYDYMARYGFTDTSKVQISIPPVSGPYDGQDGYVQVAASSVAPTAFLTLFRGPYTVNANAIAEGRPGSLTTGQTGGSGSGSVPPVKVPASMTCASPTVDGRVTSGDGYVKVGDLGAGSNDYGDVFAACDANNYFFAMRLNGPSTGGSVANENVYGCDRQKNAGRTPTPGDCASSTLNFGYHSVFATGWPSKHDFGALWKSDRARFRVACDGAVKYDFVQDYLSQVGSNWESKASGEGQVIVAGPAESASSQEWNLEHPSLTGWGDDAGEDPLNESPPFDPSYRTFDSEYSGWVWEVIYEFKVPKSSFSSCAGPLEFSLPAFEGQTGPVGGIHSSPAKDSTSSSVFLISTDGIVRLVE